MLKARPWRQAALAMKGKVCTSPQWGGRKAIATRGDKEKPPKAEP